MRKNLLRAAISFAIFCAMSFTLAGTIQHPKESTEYQFTQNDQSIMALAKGRSIHAENVLFSQGGQSAILTEFNRRPAILFENTASSTAFSTNYTIFIKNRGVHIDCIYSEIRSFLNGATTRKAICGLETPLNENYTDLAYESSDKWILEANQISIDPLFSGLPVEQVVGKVGSIDVILKYNSVDELISSTPETWLSKNYKKKLLTNKKTYLVFDKNLKGTLWVEIHDEENPTFLYPEELNFLFNGEAD